jgi:hypothetical protein
MKTALRVAFLVATAVTIGVFSIGRSVIVPAGLSPP